MPLKLSRGTHSNACQHRNIETTLHGAMANMRRHGRHWCFEPRLLKNAFTGGTIFLLFFFFFFFFSFFFFFFFFFSFFSPFFFLFFFFRWNGYELPRFMKFFRRWKERSSRMKYLDCAKLKWAQFFRLSINSSAINGMYFFFFPYINEFSAYFFYLKRRFARRF